MKEIKFTVAEEKFSLHREKAGKSNHYVYQWLNPTDKVKTKVSTVLRSKTQLRPAELLAWILSLLDASEED